MHYIRAGWREGRKPHVLFDTKWYLHSYLADAPQNPLLHYLNGGWRHGCTPTPLFQTANYLSRYQIRLYGGETPLAHYLSNWQEKPAVSPFFDQGLYEKLLPFPLKKGETPFAYCLEKVDELAVNPFCPLFDTVYYGKANPTAARDWPIVIEHFVHHGAEEGCRPNLIFDAPFYRDRYFSPGTTLLDSFFQYIVSGEAQGHRPNPLFDPLYYASQLVTEGKGHIASPLAHYLQVGLRKGLYPCSEVAELSEKPRISILTPVYNTDENILWRCVQSVLCQAYPHWELCLVDDGSSAPHIRSQLAGYAAHDPRIKVAFLEKNCGISAATNAAAKLATGEFLAFLDHDDELTSDALYQVARVINDQHPDVLYSDEDLINLESRHLDTIYKTALNKELLFTHNHLMHFFVTKSQLYWACGGLQPSFDGAQDYDLALKLSRPGLKLVHIPQVLYHWRAHATSTSVHHEQKDYAAEAGRLALQAALDREEILAQALRTDLRFFYRSQRKIVRPGRLLVYMHGQHHGNLSSLENELAVHWQDVTWITSTDAKAGAETGAINWAIREAEAEYLLFLSAGLCQFKQGSLPALIEYGQEQEIGLAGGWVEEETHSHGHRGSLPDINNASPLYYASFISSASVQHNRFHCAQYSWALRGDFSLMRRQVFLDFKGYDPSFQTLTFAHLDLCFRLREGGFHLAYTPHATAQLPQIPPPGEAILAAANADRRLFQSRWHDRLAQGDPWYNQQLLIDKGIAIPKFQAWLLG